MVVVGGQVSGPTRVDLVFLGPLGRARFSRLGTGILRLLHVSL